MEPKGLLFYPKQLAISPCTRPDQSGPRLRHIYSRFIL